MISPSRRKMSPRRSSQWTSMHAETADLALEPIRRRLRALVWGHVANLGLGRSRGTTANREGLIGTPARFYRVWCPECYPAPRCLPCRCGRLSQGTFGCDRGAGTHLASGADMLGRRMAPFPLRLVSPWLGAPRE